MRQIRGNGDMGCLVFVALLVAGWYVLHSWPWAQSAWVHEYSVWVLGCFSGLGVFLLMLQIDGIGGLIETEGARVESLCKDIQSRLSRIESRLEALDHHDEQEGDTC